MFTACFINQVDIRDGLFQRSISFSTQYLFNCQSQFTTYRSHVTQSIKNEIFVRSFVSYRLASKYIPHKAYQWLYYQPTNQRRPYQILGYLKTELTPRTVCCCLIVDILNCPAYYWKPKFNERLLDIN